ncbi:hypothetical protein D3C85_935400 [compost metagenome]
MTAVVFSATLIEAVAPPPLEVIVGESLLPAICTVTEVRVPSALLTAKLSV